MEPIEVAGLAVAGAAAGWAVARMQDRMKAPRTQPGRRIAAAGSRASQEVASGLAAIGTRGVNWSTARMADMGSLAARGIGTATDIAVSTGDTAARLVLRRPRSTASTDQPVPAVHDPAEAGLPATETTQSGLEVPVS